MSVPVGACASADAAAAPRLPRLPRGTYCFEFARLGACPRQQQCRYPHRTRAEVFAIAATMRSDAGPSLSSLSPSRRRHASSFAQRRPHKRPRSAPYYREELAQLRHCYMPTHSSDEGDGDGEERKRRDAQSGKGARPRARGTWAARPEPWQRLDDVATDVMHIVRHAL